MGGQGRELTSCKMRCVARGTSRLKTGWQRLLKPEHGDSTWARREPGHVQKEYSAERANVF